MSKNTQANNYFASSSSNYLLPLAIFGGALGLGLGAFLVKHYLTEGTVPVENFVKVAERVALLEAEVSNSSSQKKQIVELEIRLRVLSLQREKISQLEKQIQELVLQRAQESLELKEKLKEIFRYSIQTNIEMCEITADILAKESNETREGLLLQLHVLAKEAAFKTAKKLEMHGYIGIEDMFNTPPEDPHEEKLYVPLAGED